MSTSDSAQQEQLRVAERRRVLHQNLIAASERTEQAFCREPQMGTTQWDEWYGQFKREIGELLGLIRRVDSHMQVPPFLLSAMQEVLRAHGNEPRSFIYANLAMYGALTGTVQWFSAIPGYRVPHVEGWWTGFRKSLTSLASAFN